MQRMYNEGGVKSRPRLDELEDPKPGRSSMRSFIVKRRLGKGAFAQVYKVVKKSDGITCKG